VGLSGRRRPSWRGPCAPETCSGEQGAPHRPCGGQRDTMESYTHTHTGPVGEREAPWRVTHTHTQALWGRERHHGELHTHSEHTPFLCVCCPHVHLGIWMLLGGLISWVSCISWLTLPIGLCALTHVTVLTTHSLCFAHPTMTKTASHS
jgi:hypothetical protein